MLSQRNIKVQYYILFNCIYIEFLIQPNYKAQQGFPEVNIWGGRLTVRGHKETDRHGRYVLYRNYSGSSYVAFYNCLKLTELVNFTINKL